MKLCRDCENAHVSCWAPTHGQTTCNRLSRFSRVRGWEVVGVTAESERSSFMAWLGFDRCGPDAKYWAPRKPLGAPPSKPTR